MDADLGWRGLDDNEEDLTGEGASGLMDAELLRLLVERLAEKLEEVDAPSQTVVLVGGACLSLVGIRPAGELTRDLDSLTSLSEPTVRAVGEIAAEFPELGLSSGWLNSAVRMFWPQGLREQDCSAILEYGRLRVLAPPNSYLFVMKLLAYRQQDQADMRLLWPSCGFSSVEDAVELYWECYPGALVDPFLGEAVGEIISPNNSVEDTGP